LRVQFIAQLFDFALGGGVVWEIAALRNLWDATTSRTCRVAAIVPFFAIVFGGAFAVAVFFSHGCAFGLIGGFAVGSAVVGCGFLYEGRGVLSPRCFAVAGGTQG
jgi:hypothetical protein